ncbi:MAG: DUF2357 domain-containing protein [Candidatus Methanomethylophilaceae archaeon]|nr:DUF2357 domain-containing protein [Candidatus Methanomethylophilaceae archaeon]
MNITCLGPVPERPVSDCLVPEYINLDRSANIDVIHDKEDIDPQIGIQIYTGEDPFLSPILLSEETEYEIEIDCRSELLHDPLSALFDHNDTLTLKSSFFNSDNRRRTYRLYSKSYVGKGFFDIEHDDNLLKVPFEVRSKKIEYLRHYPQMLADIAEISVPMILDRKSPLYRNYDIAHTDSQTQYECFLILEYIFEKLDFESSYEFVRKNLHTELIKDKEFVPGGCAYAVDPSDAFSFVTGSSLLFANTPTTKYVPAFIPNTIYRESVDTNENRLVKELVLNIQQILDSLSNSSLGENSDYIRNHLERMIRTMDRISSDRWLEDVGALDHEPRSSTVLTKKRGYRDLFKAHMVLGMGIAFRLDGGPELIRGHEKRVYETYEYWCYLKLYQCLHKMSSNKPLLGTETVTEGISSITRRKPVHFTIPRRSGTFEVDYYYNRNFDQNNKDFRSYSIKLRPDFTLVIVKDGVKNIINLDSKYKAKIKEPYETTIDDSEIDIDCWEYDIYKMHTYRDALLRSLGSYVLYPGSGGWKNYVKPSGDDFWDDRDSKILPSVGAIPLIPGKDDRTLEHALGIILDRIGSEEGSLLL